MELNKLDFLFRCERIESPGFETGEGAVGGGQNGQGVGGVELIFNLVDDLGVFEDSDEHAEVARFFKDLGDVGGDWFGFPRRGLD